jgi:GT2 family glycosyltransferase
MRKYYVNVIIITYHSKTIIEKCIDSLVASEGAKVSITVVDNASKDGTDALVEQKYPFVTLLRNRKNVGYSQAINKGVRNTNSDFVIIANADVVFDCDAVHKLIRYLNRNPEVGVVGAQQVFPDGKWQRSYGNVPGIIDSVKNLVGITTLHNLIRRFAWPRKIDKYPKNVGYIDGAAMAIRKEAYESVGGFDENFFFYGEEADFCFRLRKSGWGVVFLPLTHIIHIRGGSSTKVEKLTDKYSKLQVDSKLVFVRKHYLRRQRQIYIIIEMIHAKKMAYIYKFIKRFAPKNKREYLSGMALSFDCLAQIWCKHL